MTMEPYEKDYSSVVSDTTSDVLIQASAGTGKTYNLVQRVLAILREDQVPIEQILVMTFTDAAAAEMQTRIYEGIKKAEKDSIDEEERTFFGEQKLRFGRHRIGTLHSFAGWVIRQSGEEVSTMTELPVPEGYEVPMALEGTVGASWTGSYELIDEYMSSMLSAQWRHDFMRAHNGFDPITKLLIITGSMSRIFGLIEKAAGLSDEALRKIARMSTDELIRITSGYAENLTREMEAPFIRLHALAQEFQACLDKEFPANLEEFILQGVDWYTKAGEISKKRVKSDFSGVSRDDILKRFKKVMVPVKSLIDLRQLYDNLVDAIVHSRLDDNPTGTLDAIAFDNMKLIGEVALRWKQYHRFKRASEGLMNFDDLIEVCHRLVCRNSTVRKRLQQKFKHLLVDEFQDTDARQWEIVHAIHGSDHERKLFLVGDMKQAIYGFRGGNVSLIRKVEQSSIHHGDQMRLATLTVSRRSAKEIIDFVNGLFAPIMSPIGHERMFQANYMPLEPLVDRDQNDPDPGIGSVRYITYEPMHRHNLVNLTAEDQRVMEFVGQGRAVIDAYKLAQFISDIRDDVNATKYPEYRNIGDLLRAGKKAIGILLRTQANVNHLMTAFRLFGIQATVRAGSGFFDRQEISDLYYLVRFLDDAWDDLALAAILRSPFFAISDVGLLAIANHVRSESRRISWWVAISGDINRIKLPKLDRTLLDHAVSLLTQWRSDIRGNRVSDVLSNTLIQTSFLPGQPDVNMATENIHKLIDLIRSFENRGNASIGQVVNWLRLQLESTSSTDAIVPGSSSIEINTMHRSKGLQYPMVILSNVTANTQPNSGLQMSPIDTHEHHTPILSWLSDEDLLLAGVKGDKKDSFLNNYTRRQIDDREKAELMRLLYVALTRAESHIVISDPDGLSKDTTKSPLQQTLQSHFKHCMDEGRPDWLIQETIDKIAYESLLNEILTRIGGRGDGGGHDEDLVWAVSDHLHVATQIADADLKRPSDHDDDHLAFDLSWTSQWNVLPPKDAGTLIHMILEWPELDAAELNQRLILELEGLDYDTSQIGVDDDVELLMQHAKNARMFIASNYANALQMISELPFEVWLPGESDTQGSWVRGSIDLLIEDEGGNWHMVDFKTANVPMESLGEFITSRKYHKQLKFYIDALKAGSQGKIIVSDHCAILLFTAHEGGKAVSLLNIIAKK